MDSLPSLGEEISVELEGQAVIDHRGERMGVLIWHGRQCITLCDTCQGMSGPHIEAEDASRTLLTHVDVMHPVVYQREYPFRYLVIMEVDSDSEDDIAAEIANNLNKRWEVIAVKELRS